MVQIDCAEIKHIMVDLTLVHRENMACGSFPKLCLLQPFKKYECQVGQALCRWLVQFPLHELCWMKCILHEKLDLLVSLMSDWECQDVKENIKSFHLFEENRNNILAAQGFIAYGVLIHALSSWYRVHYHLNLQSRKCMAVVPYSASDTPKAQSEYSHPNMAIVYTLLSILNEGLSWSQFKEAMLSLQGMGPSSRSITYHE